MKSPPAPTVRTGSQGVQCFKQVRNGTKEGREEQGNASFGGKFYPRGI